jgi:uncharacterized protein YndB with AHSA1/START domain/DNA-binding transcriptional ArsR family regulator
VTELAEPFEMSLPAVSEHLKVLERAGLIARGHHAQWRPCQLKAAPLKDVAEWVQHYRQFWEESFDRLGDYLAELRTEERKNKEKKHGGKQGASAMALTSANTADREIFEKRIFDAPRELVWKMWTDPERISKWWGPRGFTTTTSEMDVRPGGLWQHVMHGPDGRDYQNRIVYLEVVKPERIVYDHESFPVFRVTATFEAQGEKTVLAMRMVFETVELRNKTVETFDAVKGLQQTLERLSEELISASVKELVLTREFDARREAVFKAWTDPKQMAKWWGPRGFTNPVCEMDVRPGGKIRIDMCGPDGVVNPMLKLSNQSGWCLGAGHISANRSRELSHV